LDLHLASAAGIRSRTWDAVAALGILCRTLLLAAEEIEMSLVEDTPTAGTLTTLRLARAQPTGAGPRLFTRTARPNDTIQITTTAVSLDTTNVDTARLDTKIAACQGEASEFELKAQTDTVLVEVMTASRLATETLALAGTSQWTLSTPIASANTRKNRSGKSTAGATKTTTVTATVIAHTEKDTIAAATASVMTRRIAITVSQARRRSLLVVSVQLRRYLA
jgi:hypothetical protein